MSVGGHGAWIKWDLSVISWYQPETITDQKRPVTGCRDSCWSWWSDRAGRDGRHWTAFNGAVRGRRINHGTDTDESSWDIAGNKGSGWSSSLSGSVNPWESSSKNMWCQNNVKIIVPFCTCVTVNRQIWVDCGFSGARVGVNKPTLTSANDIFFSAINSGTDASCESATTHVFTTAKMNVFLWIEQISAVD